MSIINRDAVKGAVVTTGTGVVLKKARGFLRVLGLNKKKVQALLQRQIVVVKDKLKLSSFL